MRMYYPYVISCHVLGLYIRLAILPVYWVYTPCRFSVYWPSAIAVVLGPAVWRGLLIVEVFLL